MSNKAVMAITPELVKKYLHIPDSTVIKNVEYDHRTDRIVFHIDDSELLPETIEGSSSPSVTLFMKEDETGDVTSWYETHKNGWEYA